MGLAAAIACYIYWGLIVFYWNALDRVSSEELLMHRVVWTLGLVAVLMKFRGSYGEFWRGIRNPRLLGWQAIAAGLLALNWYLFVYGVTNGRIADASLGYFLCPFVTIFWGRFSEKEIIGLPKSCAIGLAAVGVGYMAWSLDQFPYIAMGIALTWGTFSVVKKRSSLGIFSGLAMEMVFIAPFALAYLIWFGMKGDLVFGRFGAGFDWLIASTGVVTIIPLLLYAYAVKRVALTTMGLLQYLMPTIAFFIALFVYKEEFDKGRMIACGCIWAGLVVFAWDSLRKPERSD